MVGYQEGMSMMESADPLVLLVGLPTIPVFLILSKMVRWEDKVLRFLRFSVRKLPLLKYILPGFGLVLLIFSLKNSLICLKLWLPYPI